jgi:hypothetical protein
VAHTLFRYLVGEKPLVLNRLRVEKAALLAGLVEEPAHRVFKLQLLVLEEPSQPRKLVLYLVEAAVAVGLEGNKVIAAGILHYIQSVDSLVHFVQ